MGDVIERHDARLERALRELETHVAALVAAGVFEMWIEALALLQFRVVRPEAGNRGTAKLGGHG